MTIFVPDGQIAIKAALCSACHVTGVVERPEGWRLGAQTQQDPQGAA